MHPSPRGWNQHQHPTHTTQISGQNLQQLQMSNQRLTFFWSMLQPTFGLVVSLARNSLGLISLIQEFPSVQPPPLKNLWIQWICLTFRKNITNLQMSSTRPKLSRVCHG